MKDCVFCKIVRGELPCYKIYENDEVLAFLDISRDIYGHTLIVPKTHAANVLDAYPAQLSAVISAAQKIGRHFVHNCGFTGVNILNASGKSAQQSVPHLHLHIIPRKKDDGHDLWPLKDKHDFNLDEMCENLALSPTVK